MPSTAGITLSAMMVSVARSGKWNWGVAGLFRGHLNQADSRHLVLLIIAKLEERNFVLQKK